MVDMPVHCEHAGAARKRRERSMRSFWRHEQMAIQTALASALHHSADKTTRAQHDAARGQKNAGTEYFELSDEEVVLARGSRPPCLGVPRGLRLGFCGTTWSSGRTFVQILGAPVPQKVEQLEDFFKSLASPDSRAGY